MLSPERAALLRKNKPNIAAYQKRAIGDSADMFDCKYKYEDGSVCAASACFTDAERELVFLIDNDAPIDEHQRTLKLSDDELTTLGNLQSAHDAYMQNGCNKNFNHFDELVKDVLGE